MATTTGNCAAGQAFAGSRGSEQFVVVRETRIKTSGFIFYFTCYDGGDDGRKLCCGSVRGSEQFVVWQAERCGVFDFANRLDAAMQSQVKKTVKKTGSCFIESTAGLRAQGMWSISVCLWRLRLPCGTR